MERRIGNFVEGVIDKALDKWDKKLSHINFSDYSRLSIPLKWIEGPDSICVSMNKKKKLSEGYFINITPEDDAIEFDKIAIINLKGNVTFFLPYLYFF